jgi:hypothetical protein
MSKQENSPSSASRQDEVTEPDLPTGLTAAEDNVPTPTISKSLCEKAEKHNDKLTKVERILLFSRCDIVGKALAYPDSLNERQRNLVMYRPPPEMLAANIKKVIYPQSVLGCLSFLTYFFLYKKVTNGAMSTITEMRAVDPNLLTYQAMECVNLSFWTWATRCFMIQDPILFDTGAGSSACSLVTPADEFVWQDAVREVYTDPATDKREDKLLYNETDPRISDMSDSEKSQKMKDIVAEYTIQVERLRREMGTQVRRELDGLTPEELVEMETLKERMRVESEQDAKEEAQEVERLAEKRRRELEKYEEEYEEKKRRKREKRRKKQQRWGREEDDDESSQSDDNREDSGEEIE